MSDIVPGSVNVIALLRADHGHIKNLLHHLETCDLVEQRRFLADLFLDLRIHSGLEQQLIFPNLAEHVPKEKLARCSKELYTMLSMMLELESTKVSSGLYLDTLSALRLKFEQHVDHDECLFSELQQQNCSQLTSLADKMQSCRAELTEKLKVNSRTLTQQAAA